MVKKLKRVAGRPLVTEFSLVTQPKVGVVDPNGYYELLGLDPAETWTPFELRTAYRMKMREYHPDGSDPDMEKFAEVQVAYAVLGDPDLRGHYDKLESTRTWLDKQVVSELVKRLVASDAIDPVEVVATTLKNYIEHPVRVPFDEYCYFYYEGEDVPDERTRGVWFELVKRAAWDRGYRGEEIKVGFTTCEPHVLVRKWGRILMLGGEPTPEHAETLVDSYHLSPTSPG